MSPDNRRVRVAFAGVTIADTSAAVRVLETSHPPSFYIPPADVRAEFLVPVERHSFCEWKGVADYWTVKIDGITSVHAAWSYPKPTPRFEGIKGYVAFYVSRVQDCYVGDERAVAQDGDFYGGWITSEIKGPFKGAPGTHSW